MKKICYGKSNFPYVMRSNGYYIDKSMFIEKLEGLGTEYLFFLRPRRFGKSLFVSMLEAYYDINTAEEFDELFGNLYIGKNPTPLRNRFPILKFNFSRIKGRNSLESLQTAFDLNILSSIETFYKAYPEQTGGITAFDRDIKSLEEADIMFDRFLYKMEQINFQFYLLIDEYDNFANNVLADIGKESYYNLTHGTGFLRNFFTVIKAGTDSNTIARMFATGVSPLVLSDVTSGFYIGVNISTSDKFHDLVGFDEQDVNDIITYFIAQGLICESIKEPLLDIMKKYYDGYRFSPNIQGTLYNSTLVLYLLQQYELSLETQKNKIPLKIIDSNLMTDYTKLEFLIIEGQLQGVSLRLENNSQPKLNGNFNYLSKLLLKEECQSELIETVFQ